MTEDGTLRTGGANLDDLVGRLRGVIEPLPFVRWAYLCGSAARGESFRDLDVGVMLSPGLPGGGALSLGSLVAALEEALPGQLIDVIDLESASAAVRGETVRDGVLVADRDKAARLEWEIDTVRRWLDLAPWLARGEALRLEALGERHC